MSSRRLMLKWQRAGLSDTQCFSLRVNGVEHNFYGPCVGLVLGKTASSRCTLTRRCKILNLHDGNSGGSVTVGESGHALWNRGTF